MDRCEVCPLSEGKLQIEECCDGGLPISVCIAKLQHCMAKLNLAVRDKENSYERNAVYELEP